MRRIPTSYGKRIRVKLFCVAVLLYFFTPPAVFADGPPRSETLAFHAVTDTQSNAIQAKRVELTGNNPAARFAESIQESMRSVRSGLEAPRRDHAAKTKNLTAMRAVNEENKLSRSLKNKRDALRVWYRPGSPAPRQIRLKSEARKDGDVLMEAIREGISRRDRDEKTSRAFLHANGPLMRITRPDEELVLVRYQEDELERRHLRYQQKYKGISLWPAEVNVHLDANGNVDVFNSSHAPTPSKLVTKPVVTSQTAMDLARKAIKGGDGARVSEPELIVFADGGNSRLAWKMLLSVALDAYWLVVIDAHRGTVLTAYNQVYTDGLVDGSGTDLLGTVRSLNLWLESGKYHLVDTSKAMYDAASDPPAINTTKGAIIVSDMDHTDLPDQGGAFNYKQITSTAANSGWLADGVSLAYALSQTYDYYKAIHGRNSIDTEGGSILGFVRTSTNSDNAFWTPEYNAMFFGDAEKYAAALDVVAHEYTHGVTISDCNLVYQDQSGALSEAFSDIFGEMVEARTNGNTDWIIGTVLNVPLRDMKNTSSLEIIPGSGYYYPSKMSQFYGRSSPLLQQLTNQDNGGVHINCAIVSHAFYLLAEGLPGAIGKVDAAKIFYRAQAVHLLSGSQFTDARLACITSAEELFGQDSTQAKKTAEAFDAVEIFENAQTPEPPPSTPVSGDDSAVFIYYDIELRDYYLAAYETSKEGFNWLSYYPVSPQRPSVSGDGALVFFVNAYYDACFIATDPQAGSKESCLGFYDTISSVSMSPDKQLYGFVLRGITGNPTNEIIVVDLRDGGETRTFKLSASATEGALVNTVLFADAMDFTSDNRYLIYDAFNVLTMPDNTQIGVWSIYALDLATEQIIALTPPVRDFEVGYPAVSQTTNHIITFEVVDDSSHNSTIMTMNLLDGNVTPVGQVDDPWGIPGYTGDDGAIVYTKPDSSTYTGFSLYRQALQADRQTPAATPPTLVFPAGASGGAYGVVFRRGTYSPPVPNISVSRTSLVYGTVTTGGSATKSLLIANNGTGNLRINNITLAGANAADFKMSGSCSGQTLPASGTCAMSVVFAPKLDGDKTASLSIQSDDPDTPTTVVALSGTANTTKDELVLNFGPGYGLYQYDQAGGWKPWNTANPSQMVTVDLNGDGTDELFAAFAGYGLYTYDSTNGWQLINTVIPEFMSAYRNNRIACDYGAAYGLWLWDQTGGWQQINTVDPDKMIVADIDGDGDDELVTSFVGYGLYYYDAPGVWTQINTAIPDAMAAPYSNGVVCDFGAAYGLWSYSKSGGWVQLNTADPDKVVAVDMDNDGQDELVVSFAGYGLYTYEPVGGLWQQINTVIPDGMIRQGNGIAVDFGATYGLWYWDASGGWVQRNTVDPGQMTAVDIDNDGVEELAASFSGYGLYYFDETIGWQLLNTVLPVDMKPINFYP